MAELKRQKHSLSWYKPGRQIDVNDKMQKNYTYILQEQPGKNFDAKFTPELTPQQMLNYGVFEGKYLNDCEYEFPKEWYKKASKNNKLSINKPNIECNLFKIKSRLSLKEWKKRKWIPILNGDKDIRGWFQWYCRYWIGRRIPDIDKKQIARWRSFKRHKGQILKSLQRMTAKSRPKTFSDLSKHRPKQRQALLQWAYNPYANI